MKTLLFLLLSFSISVSAEMCKSWSKPQKVGELDSDLLPEASGLAISAKYADRLYHINDKGNELTLVTTKMDGSNGEAIEIEGVKATDTEELALGPCGSESCVYIGDIGDNDVERKSINVAWIQEKSSYEESEKVTGKIKLTYPDGPHNAEAMIIHPQTGDLFIFTKGQAKNDEDTPALPSYIFHLSARDLHSKKSAELVLMGSLDLPALLSGEDYINQIATGAAVSSDGGKLLLLTYKNIVQVNWDFQTPVSADIKALKFDVLPKAEAIAFIPNSLSVLVTTESKKSNASIMRFDCRP